MLVILLNCVTLGMYQPCDDMECLSDRCKILQVSLPPFWGVLSQPQGSTPGAAPLLSYLIAPPASFYFPAEGPHPIPCTPVKCSG